MNKIAAQICDAWKHDAAAAEARAERDHVEIDQDWAAECTRYQFVDGSILEFSGGICRVIEEVA